MVAAGLLPEPYVDVAISQPITIDVPTSGAMANFLTPGVRTNVVVTVSSASVDGKTPQPVIEILSPKANVDSALHFYDQLC
jgi:hypothetical protein